MQTVRLEAEGSRTGEKARSELEDLPKFRSLSEKDWIEFGRYFKNSGATAVVFAPDVLRTFVIFSQKGLFPTTLEGAKAKKFSTRRYNTPTLLGILEKSDMLERLSMTPSEAKKSATMGKDEKEAVKGKRNVEVWTFTSEFMREGGALFKKLGLHEHNELAPDGHVIMASEINDLVRVCEGL